MGSTQRGTVYHVVNTNKIGSKAAVSTQRGAEASSTSPQRGYGHVVALNQRGAAGSLSPLPHRRSEAAHPTAYHLASDYPRSLSPPSGLGLSRAPSPQGIETRPRSEINRHPYSQRRSQQTQTPASHAIYTQRNVSPPRDEVTRKSMSLAGRDSSHRTSVTADAKSSRRLSFLDQKDNLQSLPEEDPPSKVQNPQGVRVPRRISVYPKDEAVQTEPVRRTFTAAEVRSPKRPSSPEHGSSRVSADSRAAQRRNPGQESEMGPPSSNYPEFKAFHKNMNLDSSLKFSILRDSDGPHRVPVRPEPESVHKYSVYSEPKTTPKVLVSSEVESNTKSSIRGDNDVSRRVTISPGAHSAQSPHRVTARAVPEGSRKSSTYVTPEPMYKQKYPETVHTSPGSALRSPEPVHAELELTPRPLPPRSLPRYGPDSSWWALLNPEVEMFQSRPTTPDFELKSPPPPDPLSSLFEMDTSPFCEDLMFQREKASPPPPPPPPSPKEPPSWAPLREVLQAPKHTFKQPIQRFSAFFLDVSEEMYNRVIWWLKG
ncbi:septin-4 isoform X3 [Tamandua tetradactyla]